MLLTIQDWSLPIRNPVFLFSILLLTILVAPAILQRLRIPGLVGFILAGAILGPHGINLLEHGEGIKLLATGGLLYIMFWAGLEINMTSFLKTRHKSFAFGMFTFLLPLTLGGLGSFYLLGFDGRAALLLASMFSTHTLISYPIVNRLRLAQNEAVTITVGGTIITDTLALLLLAVISGMEQGTVGLAFWVKLAFGLTVFGAIVLGLLPLVARWFFRRVESDLTYQYVFVLATVFLCGLLAEIAGVEAIIGAFMAGLVLNRLIPHTSPLMNRIEFVGNSIFIPAFLFSVGMLVNLNVFLKSQNTIVISLVLTAIALLTKWLAAWATQKLYGYSSAQRNLIFGLSSSHAAATIAIILIGYQINLFDEEVLNSAVFLILVTCLVSTFVTDKTARKMVAKTVISPLPESVSPQRILVPFSNPETVTQLVDFSFLIKSAGQNQPVYPLSIILDEKNARERIMESQRLIEPLLQHAAERQLTLSPIHRVDVSAVSGILRASKEILATDIVIGWRPKISATEKIFGTLHDQLMEETAEMIFVVHFTKSPMDFDKLKVVFGPKTHQEPGFAHLSRRLINTCKSLNAALHLMAPTEGADAFKKLAGADLPKEFQTNTPEHEEAYFSLHENPNPSELTVFVSARREACSFENWMEKIPAYLTEHFAGESFVLVFPAI